LLVFSNTDLTNSRVHNFKKMERRRVVFKLGVIYQTPSEKIESHSANGQIHHREATECDF